MSVTKANRDIKSLQPVAQRAARLFLDECKRQGLGIFVTEYHRSQARQNHLYEQGRTRPGKKVTWTRNSNHTSGYAWDIACSPPQNLYDRLVLLKAGAIAKKLGIEWGGDWKQADTPHFQVTPNWKPPKKTDEQLEKAVQKLVLSGVKINAASWNSLARMNLRYAQALVEKIGKAIFKTSTYEEAVEKMIEVGIINTPQPWEQKQFKKENIRWLLIKTAKHLG